MSPQPYLSSQLKHIEHELGVTLTIRNTRNFQLTDAGKRFYNRVIQILELMDTTKQENGADSFCCPPHL